MNLSKGTKEMGQFGIGIHSYASDLSLSHPFWGILQPQCIGVRCLFGVHVRCFVTNPRSCSFVFDIFCAISVRVFSSLVIFIVYGPGYM